MAASRARALRSGRSKRFWLGAFCIALMPTSVGYQDFAALRVQRPVVAYRSHAHLLASPFGTIEPATFSYGIRPIGTTMPQPPAIELVNFDPRSFDADVGSTAVSVQRFDYPAVVRRLKGDRLAVAHAAPGPAEAPRVSQAQPDVAAPAAQPGQPSASLAPSAAVQSRPAQAPDAPVSVAHSNAVTPQSAAAAPAKIVAANAHPDAPRSDGGALAAVQSEVPAAGDITSSGTGRAVLAYADSGGDGAGTQVYFGSGTMDAPSGLQQWEPGAEPVMVSTGDPAANVAAVEGPSGNATASGLATGKDESRLESPAQRLGLTGQARVKAEKCLTQAVYFEARGEPLRGQEAVAQVVMNRVFSGYYPNDVCGVVFQNADHYLACQFTFACEGKNLNRIDEPDMWEQATRIAKDTLDGKIWLPDIGHATHYHAYWVHPSWVHEMTRLYKLGVHTFYRPRAWGNGDYEPVWGAPQDTSKANLSPDAATKGPQAQAAPAPAAQDSSAKL